MRFSTNIWSDLTRSRRQEKSLALSLLRSIISCDVYIWLTEAFRSTRLDNHRVGRRGYRILEEIVRHNDENNEGDVGIHGWPLRRIGQVSLFILTQTYLLSAKLFICNEISNKLLWSGPFHDFSGKKYELQFYSGSERSLVGEYALDDGEANAARENENEDKSIIFLRIFQSRHPQYFFVFTFDCCPHRIGEKKFRR